MCTPSVVIQEVSYIAGPLEYENLGQLITDCEPWLGFPNHEPRLSTAIKVVVEFH
jgi:hypothetical protein